MKSYLGRSTAIRPALCIEYLRNVLYLAFIVKGTLMATPDVWPASLAAALLLTPSAAFAAESMPPNIDTMVWEEAETVCEAWPEEVAAKDAHASGLSWVSYPAAVEPFGMRGYVAIDGVVHPLRQVAYAKPDRTLSIYYRTLGDRHYDVYLTLSGLDAAGLKGTDLAGTLVVSRFGLFSQIKIVGACGVDLN